MFQSPMPLHYQLQFHLLHLQVDLQFNYHQLAILCHTMNLILKLLQNLSMIDRMKQLLLLSHSKCLLQVVDLIFYLVVLRLKVLLQWLRFLLHQLQKFLRFQMHLHLSQHVHPAIRVLPFFPLNFLLLGLRQDTPRDQLHHQFIRYLLHLLIKIVRILHAQSHISTLLPDHHVAVCGLCKLGYA